MKYGYDTPEAFSKAFRRLHGISPSAAREPGARLKAIPRISFHISLKGDKDMDYRIIEKDAFQAIGEARKFTTKDGLNFKEIPMFWQEFNSNNTCEKLQPYNKSDTMLGICMEMEHDKESFTYMIGVETDNEKENKEFSVKNIPASTWAVFTSIGPMPTAIQKVWDRIFQEWFPATGYEHAGTAELEVYLPGNPDAGDYRCEVWIPIIKR
ncbi:MAG: effector binding domain-containing protein [Bacillota bacterium]